ncbi:hypothetical protein, partial [Pseudomonas sp.]|uniref:hypothetical protein n=1 Tax=Pseudomonas sp. TaxID=306 RepID=UPI0028B071CC
PARRIADKSAPTFVATCHCLSGHGCPPLAPAEKLRRTNKAGNHGLSGIGTLQQMWERIYPRCAARAALDLTDTENRPSSARMNSSFSVETTLFTLAIKHNLHTRKSIPTY